MRHLLRVPFLCVLVVVLLQVLCIPPTTALKAPSPTATTCNGDSSTSGWSWNIFPAGRHPFGYKITALGEEFLTFHGSLDSDIGRLLSSLKNKRKTLATLKANWLEVVRVAKTGQAMRITRRLEEYIKFCLEANLID